MCYYSCKTKTKKLKNQRPNTTKVSSTAMALNMNSVKNIEGAGEIASIMINRG